MQQITITQLTLQELVDSIVQPLLERIEVLESQDSKRNNDSLYSREQTASDIFNVDLSTLHRWTQQGKIKAHALGNRIYYKESSIQEALVELLPTNKRV